MGQGKDLYEENKRLREANDNLRLQAENRRLEREAAVDRMADIAIASVHRFLVGGAAFHITVCGQPTYEVRFNCDPPPAPPRQPADASTVGGFQPTNLTP